MENIELRLIPLQFKNNCSYYCSPDGNVWRELKGRQGENKIYLINLV